MRVDLFDYDLPAELIAQQPAPRRDGSRLLVLHRSSGEVEHRSFAELGDLLRPDDCLVLNDTRVLPARLVGRRAATGGQWEGLYLGETSGLWELMTKTRGKPTVGERIVLDTNALELELVRRTESGAWLARPLGTGPSEDLLNMAGQVPLPPYIRGGREGPGDRERYQTVYAHRAGAVAAPTAGLHFTKELLDDLRHRGIELQWLTLHVGAGTFKPVSATDTDEHHMHSEWCELTPSVAERLNALRMAGRRLVAVGTTTTRVLESAAQAAGSLEPFTGQTRLFIVPGYQYRAVDVLLTNFHLPKSTLLMLVSAFAGREAVLNAYHEAIRERYRFYSFGDAMLIM